MDNPKKYKIQVEFLANGVIRRSDGILSDEYDRDFYITVPIFKNITLDDYVDVEIDPLRATVERQF